MDTNLRSQLAELDAAPRQELTPAELRRRADLLSAVLSDRESAAPAPAHRRPLVRRMAFTLAGGLAAGVAFVAVTNGTPGSQGGGSGPLSSAELSSWTGTPTALSASTERGSAAEKWCVEESKNGPGSGSPAEISHADIRGKVASMVVTRADQSLFCLVGSEDTGMWEAIDPVAELPADDVTLQTAGANGTRDSMFDYVVGSAGDDVEAIVVKDQGKTVRATLQDGRWTAWWPAANSDGRVTGTVTITLSDGTTRTVGADSLRK